MNKNRIKNVIYKLLPKFIYLFLIIFSFDILLNHLTLYDSRETLFEFDRIAVENIEQVKRRPRWRIGYFFCKDLLQRKQLPYTLELELYNKLENLKLEISLNKSIIARRHIKEKGTTVLDIPFDNDILQANNTILIRSNRIRWELQKMSLVRKKRIVDGKMEIIFSLQNFVPGNRVAYKLEIKLTNTFAPLDLDVVLNQSALKKVHIKCPGRNKLLISVDKAILKKKNHLQLRSESTGWCLDCTDILRDYGFSGGLLFFNPVKKESGLSARDWKEDCPSYEKFILLLLLWILIALVFIPSGEACPESKGHSKTNRAVLLSLGVWGLFVLIPLCVPLVSSYRIVFSVKTIILLLAVPILLLAYHKRSLLNRKRILIPAVISAAFLLAALDEVNMNLHQGNFSGLIRINASKIKEIHRHTLGIPTEKLIMRERGYDGQLFYFVSFDPFLTQFKKPENLKGFIPDPIYRYSRIGFPLLINMFSLGNKAVFPEVMLLLIIFSHLFASYFLLRILEYHNIHTFFTFLYLLIPGYIWSLNRALPESIAGGFLLAGFFYYLEKKPGLVMFSLAVAVLVRETSLIFVFTLTLYHIIKFRKIRTPLFSAAALVPFLLWRIFLTSRFLHIHGLSALCHCPSNLTLPFYGFYKTYQALITGTYRSKNLYVIGFIFPVILTLILVLAVRLVLKEIDVANITLLLYSLLSVSLNYDKVWLHAGNGIRVTYEVFLFLILTFITCKTVKYRVFFYIIFFLIFVSAFFYLPQLRLLTFGLAR